MPPRGSGAAAPGGALRAIDSDDAAAILADLRPAPPLAAISAWPACHVGWCGMSSDRPEETAAEPEPRLGPAVRYQLRLAVAEHHWPPAAHPSPPGRATLGGRLR